MLRALAQRLGSGLVIAVLIAVAGGVVVVAAAFAAYAGLKTLVSPSAASALTAAIFAVVTALIATVAPKLLAPPKDQSRQARLRRGQSQGSARPDLAQAGIAALALVADLALSHRLKRQEKARDHNRSSRR